MTKGKKVEIDDAQFRLAHCREAVKLYESGKLATLAAEIGLSVEKAASIIDAYEELRKRRP